VKVDPLSVIGILLSLGIAAWEHRKGKRSEDRLERLIDSIPRQLTSNLPRLGSSAESGGPSPYSLVDSHSPFHVQEADLDGDGQKELLIQYIAGAHGSALQLYGMQDFEFKLLGELSTDTPAGFEVADLDSDGRLKLRTYQADYSTGLGYAFAPRLEIWYRWNGSCFGEVMRRKAYTEEELEERRRAQESL
jgi:hypothetical protein